MLQGSRTRHSGKSGVAQIQPQCGRRRLKSPIFCRGSLGNRSMPLPTQVQTDSTRVGAMSPIWNDFGPSIDSGSWERVMTNPGYQTSTWGARTSLLVTSFGTSRCPRTCSARAHVRHSSITRCETCMNARATFRGQTRLPGTRGLASTMKEGYVVDACGWLWRIQLQCGRGGQGWRRTEARVCRRKGVDQSSRSEPRIQK